MTEDELFELFARVREAELVFASLAGDRTAAAMARSILSRLEANPDDDAATRRSKNMSAHFLEALVNAHEASKPDLRVVALEKSSLASS